MQIFFFIIFALIFCFINYKIIISDQKTKKIPNKNLLELLILLPFWWIFLYAFPFAEINIFGFLVQILVSFLVSFLLYNFGIWRAGDAKYLLVLSLFIPHIGIIPFIGNLGLFTLFYLFLYFLWFFFGRGFFYKGYFKSLLQSIKIDLSEKWKVHKHNKGGKSFWIILKWLVVFLIIFVSIRLFRIYLFLEFFQNFGGNQTLTNIFQKYHFYLIFAGIGATIAFFYFGKKLINFLKKFFAEKFKINLTLVGNIFLGILFIALVSFIGFEYHKNPDEITAYLIKILTFYIAIYIFAKIIFYSYKLSFLSSEEIFIDIKDLKSGDIVDKNYLHKMFSTQQCLGAHNYEEDPWNEDEKQEILEKFPYFIFLEPHKFFLELKNPINEESKNLLQKIYKISNRYLKESGKKSEFLQENHQIKIFKTFSFGIYIFLGFVMTFIFGNQIINFITKKIIELISF